MQKEKKNLAKPENGFSNSDNRDLIRNSRCLAGVFLLFLLLTSLAPPRAEAQLYSENSQSPIQVKAMIQVPGDRFEPRVLVVYRKDYRILRVRDYLDSNFRLLRVFRGKAIFADLSTGNTSTIPLAVSVKPTGNLPGSDFSSSIQLTARKCSLSWFLGLVSMAYDKPLIAVDTKAIEVNANMVDPSIPAHLAGFLKDQGFRLTQAGGFLVVYPENLGKEMGQAAMRLGTDIESAGDPVEVRGDGLMIGDITLEGLTARIKVPLGVEITSPGEQISEGQSRLYSVFCRKADPGHLMAIVSAFAGLQFSVDGRKVILGSPGTGD